MSRELALLGRVVALSRDADVCLGEFEKAVATSPRLATEVVRVANSPLYGMEGRIHQLQRAVLLLGVEPVTAIATSILVGSQLQRARIGPVSGDDLWAHSLEVALCSQLVSRCLGLRLEAECYLLGLIHDLGMLELQRDHGRRYALLLQQRAAARSLDRLELESFGETHAQRLTQRLRSWGFPELLVAPAGAHHAPRSAGSDGQLLASVACAAHAILASRNAAFCDPSEEAEHSAALADLALHPDDVADVRLELDAQLKRFSAVLSPAPSRSQEPL